MIKISEMYGPSITKLEHEYVSDALNNFSGSKKYEYVEQFEEEFARYNNRKYCLMTSNCTAAIWLALEVLGINQGDEVITPELTWIASIAPAIKMGAKPIFADVGYNWCLKENTLQERLSNQTKVIIPVWLYGNYPYINWTKYTTINDAAEALGSFYMGKPAGKFGTIAVFSFHRTKTLCCGEGGAFLTDEEELYKKAKRQRDHGRDENTLPYLNDEVGYKFMPFNVQAALALAQLHRIDKLLQIKRSQFQFYRNNLLDWSSPIINPYCNTLQFNDDSEYDRLNLYSAQRHGTMVNAAWTTAIEFRAGIKKDYFIKQMERFNIPIRPFFYPLSSIPAIKERKWRSLNLNAYNISERGINLPGSMNLKQEELQYICDSFKEVLSEFVKA